MSSIKKHIITSVSTICKYILDVCFTLKNIILECVSKFSLYVCYLFVYLKKIRSTY